MSTTEFMSVARPATQLEVAKRERHAFGPGASISYIKLPMQGTTVPALIQTSVKGNPAAAVQDGDASGLRLWRHPV